MRCSVVLTAKQSFEAWNIWKRFAAVNDREPGAGSMCLKDTATPLIKEWHAILRNVFYIGILTVSLIKLYPYNRQLHKADFSYKALLFKMILFIKWMKNHFFFLSCLLLWPNNISYIWKNVWCAVQYCLMDILRFNMKK